MTLETAPAALWDAVVIPAGDTALANLGQAKEFLKDQYRHCKPILLLDPGSALAAAIEMPATLPDGSIDPGVATDTSAFVAALASHRAFEREVDPPRI